MVMRLLLLIMAAVGARAQQCGADGATVYAGEDVIYDARFQTPAMTFAFYRVDTMINNIFEQNTFAASILSGKVTSIALISHRACMALAAPL